MDRGLESSTRGRSDQVDGRWTRVGVGERSNVLFSNGVGSSLREGGHPAVFILGPSYSGDLDATGASSQSEPTTLCRATCDNSQCPGLGELDQTSFEVVVGPQHTVLSSRNALSPTCCPAPLHHGIHSMADRRWIRAWSRRPLTVPVHRYPSPASHDTACTRPQASVARHSSWIRTDGGWCNGRNAPST